MSDPFVRLDDARLPLALDLLARLARGDFSTQALPGGDEADKAAASLMWSRVLAEDLEAHETESRGHQVQGLLACGEIDWTDGSAIGTSVALATTGACRTIREEHPSGRVSRMEVNVSGVSVSDPESLELIKPELAALSGLASDLVCELTKTAAVTNLAHANAFAEGIRPFGCHLTLDDFGVGFGSFYLKHLPCRYLKTPRATSSAARPAFPARARRP